MEKRPVDEVGNDWDSVKRFDKQTLRTILNSNLDYETVLKIIGSVNLESSRAQNMLQSWTK